jgi:hypothetical protein
MERTYRQITCKRTVTGDQFTRGVIDVDFSIGGKTTWIPSKSYFRVGVAISGATAGESPTITEDVVVKMSLQL